MQVHIQSLRHHEAVRRILARNGWRLDREGGPRYFARHPAVKDQEDARGRLNDVGLLTSSAVRIEFDPRSSTGHRRGAAAYDAAPGSRSRSRR
jgi:hypothetical protein